jgi:hypothetical protein
VRHAENEQYGQLTGQWVEALKSSAQIKQESIITKYFL